MLWSESNHPIFKPESIGPFLYGKECMHVKCQHPSIPATLWCQEWHQCVHALIRSCVTKDSKQNKKMLCPCRFIKVSGTLTYPITFLPPPWTLVMSSWQWVSDWVMSITWSCTPELLFITFRSLVLLKERPSKFLPAYSDNLELIP